MPHISAPQSLSLSESLSAAVGQTPPPDPDLLGGLGKGAPARGLAEAGAVRPPLHGGPADGVRVGAVGARPGFWGHPTPTGGGSGGLLPPAVPVGWQTAVTGGGGAELVRAMPSNK